ncbi:MAG: MarR family transcriptional regulator, temperature-dependent positive regulator of motility [Desulfovibrionales bacterium]|nr:MarR family transcriptional regulator, temperature-dependent positive regulator of motility [Desulfovibrionales bacterium]
MTGEKRLQTASDEELATLLHQAARLMGRGGRRRGRGRRTQRRLLSIIVERGPILQSELLELLDVRSSSLSEVLGKLERNGWIVRERNENDKRGFVVSATEQGKSLCSDPEEARESADGLFACLDDEERGRLAEALEKLVSSLKDDPVREGGFFGRREHGRMRRDNGPDREDERRSEGFGRGRRGRDRHGRGE